jgi:hypothetical protein
MLPLALRWPFAGRLVLIMLCKKLIYNNLQMYFVGRLGDDLMALFKGLLVVFTATIIKVIRL